MTESVLNAKIAQIQERERVYQQTGLRLTDQPIRVPAAAIIIGCPKQGCTHSASARNEGRATRSLVSHIVRAHGGTV